MRTCPCCPAVSIACVVLVMLTIPSMMAIGIAALVLVIIAAIKTNEGVSCRYPLTLRLVK